MQSAHAQKQPPSLVSIVSHTFGLKHWLWKGVGQIHRGDIYQKHLMVQQYLLVQSNYNSEY